MVLGAGESGVGTAILGQSKGYQVVVSDIGSIAPHYKKELDDLQIPWEEGQHSAEFLSGAELVMKSPGIPDHVKVVKDLLAQGIPVVSEIEFASRYTDAKIIAITGSNGKTTTTSLAFHLLQSEGLDVDVAGNIGYSYAKKVALAKKDFYVLEISSFQLDGTVDFKPYIAIITNITPDHLDRYEYKFENYIASKFRICQNQDENDFLIYDADDAVITDWLQRFPPKCQLIPFSLTESFETGAYLNNDNITINLFSDSFDMTKDTLPITGQHNVKHHGSQCGSTISERSQGYHKK